jgi:ABC-type multidrug transport system ATPase subunit
MEPLLDVNGLSRSFGQVQIIRGLTVSLTVGERVALTGPNGSGKSTVLRCIAGTLLPDGGSIIIDGYPAGSLHAKKLVGSSFAQERAFYLRLSCRENLMIFSRLRHRNKRAARTQTDELIEELQLGRMAAKRADHCSSGMLQQLSFARSLLGDPRLLLLDEATRSLDEEATERFWDALDRRPGVAVLMATHLESDVSRCHDKTELTN